MQTDYIPMNANRPATTTPLDPTDTIRSVEQAEALLAYVEELVSLAQLAHTKEPYHVTPPDYPLPANFKLSLVIPVYNEERTIREVLARVASLPIAKEIVVVDDCSRDSTPQILRELQGSKELNVIFKPKNEGKGAALRTGFRHVTGDIVVVQDADLEYDPRDILNLLPPILNKEADVVYGSRFLHEVPHDKSLFHRQCVQHSDDGTASSREFFHHPSVRA